MCIIFQESPQMKPFLGEGYTEKKKSNLKVFHLISDKFLLCIAT